MCIVHGLPAADLPWTILYLTTIGGHHCLDHIRIYAQGVIQKENA